MRKGKGKEYYSNLKLFDEDFFDKEIIKGKRFYYFSDILEEGGYLNGNIWNGKAMKYRNDKLVYEEEISNGKKIKEKEYYNGQLEFGGEYLNGGKKWSSKRISL